MPDFAPLPGNRAEGNALQQVIVSGNTTGTTSSVPRRKLIVSAAGAVTAGFSNSMLMLSVATSLSNVNVSAGTTSNNLSALTFSNSNGVSFGLNGSTLTGSVATSLTNVNVSAGTTSNNLSAITFSNSNGVSFGLNGSTVTGSVSAQSNQAGSVYGVGNTSGTSSGTYDGRTLSISGVGIITVAASNSGFILNATTAAQTNQAGSLYAIGNTSGTSSGTYDARTISLSGLGAVTIAASNSGYNINVPVQSNQSAIKAFGASNTGNTAGNTGVSTGVDWVIAATTNITVSQSTTAGGPNTIWLSGGAGGAGGNFSAGASNVGNTAGNTGITGTRVILAGGNNVTVSQGTDANGATITVSAFNQTNQAGSVYGLGNTTGTSSGTYDARTLSINVSGALSIAASNSGFNLSVPPTSSLSATGWVSLTTNGSTISIGASTTARFYVTGNTFGTSSGTGGVDVMSLSGGSGLLVAASNGGWLVGQQPLYTYAVYPVVNVTNTALLSVNTATSGSATFVPFEIDAVVAAGWLQMVGSMSFVTMGTSSGRQSATFNYGLYTRGSGANSSTISQVTSNSFSVGVTYNNSTITVNQPTTSNNTGFGTATTTSAGLNLTSGYTGLAMLQLPVNSTLVPGAYWLGLFNRESTSSNSGGFKFSYLGYGDSLSNMAPIGSFSTAYTTGTNILGPASGVPVGGNWHIGHGVFTSAGQTNLPSTLALSAMSVNVTVLPFMKFLSTQ